MLAETMGRRDNAGMPSLGVNIDHIATLREARYRGQPANPNAEPDPVASALVAEEAGASGITVHLREDRRHIQDRDVFGLRERIRTKLNLEMGISDDIVDVALRVRPDDICVVPENRQEVTTEGGLDCAGLAGRLRDALVRLRGSGARISLFIDPEEVQVEAAAALGADFVELHTGAYANASGDQRGRELDKLCSAASLAVGRGLRVNAGHGLNLTNTAAVLVMPGLEELNIGHSIISRSVAIGLHAAVAEMCRIVSGGCHG